MDYFKEGEIMTDQTNGFGESIKFYYDREKKENSRTCLQCQFVLTRAGEPTVQIELAPIVGPTNQGQTEHSKKKIIQLTVEELRIFCVVLFGIQLKMEQKYHGDGNNKSFRAQSRPTGTLIQISGPGICYSHVLNPTDRMDVSVFVLRRLAESWKISLSDALTVLKTHHLYSHSK